MFDIPILGAILAPHYLKFVSKRELARPLDPEHLVQPSGAAGTRSSIAATARRRSRPSASSGVDEVAGRGVSAVIFPEGTRARGGVLGPVPAAGDAGLDGGGAGRARRARRHRQLLAPSRARAASRPFGTRVRVFIGSPIERSPR
jgi:1-acyl-sn-glycerol-3-phosphate acyltransferase